MERIFKIVLIDDMPDETVSIMENVKLRLEKRHGYKIEYSLISKKAEFAAINQQLADIVMFDYNLSTGNFTESGSTDNGHNLLKAFRELNKRTKVIFYSSRFTNDVESALTAQELISLINEQNVFKIISRSPGDFINSIASAIANIDTVLISFDELITEYGDNGTFLIDKKEFTASELLNELKQGTKIGEDFRSEVNKTILHYFMKFGGKDE